MVSQFSKLLSSRGLGNKHMELTAHRVFFFNA